MEAIKGAEQWRELSVGVVQSKSAKKRQASESGLSQPSGSGRFQVSSKIGVQSSHQAATFKKGVIVASRMPELPSTHQKIIVIPQDGSGFTRNQLLRHLHHHLHGGRNHRH
ncbi:hypothetical protein MRX96_028026 [Rhipicephalus microplus]